MVPDSGGLSHDTKREQLLKTLAKRINRKGMTWRRLYEYRTFYNVYPQLQSEILRYLQSQMQRPTELITKKLQSLPAISPEPWQTAPDRLFHRIADYSETLVKYSTEGLEDIYVAKYLQQLPSEDTIRQYLIDNMPDHKAFEEYTEDTNE